LKKNRILLGITKEVLEQNSDIKNAYNMAKALPLLPASEIENGINIISGMSTDPRMVRFVEYLRREWLPRK